MIWVEFSSQHWNVIKGLAKNHQRCRKLTDSGSRKEEQQNLATVCVSVSLFTTIKHQVLIWMRMIWMRNIQEPHYVKLILRLSLSLHLRLYVFESAYQVLHNSCFTLGFMRLIPFFIIIFPKKHPTYFRVMAMSLRLTSDLISAKES